MRGAQTILRAVTNPLQIKNLVRGAWCVVCALTLVGCGGKPQHPTPEPTTPLPTAGIAAQPVAVLPLTLVAAEDSLHWEKVLSERRTVLTRCDSIIAALLKERAPEVNWVLPDELRRIAHRSPGIAPSPDQMGSAILFRGTMAKPEMVPDPLRSELRTLAALAGGGRFALIPAGLAYKRSKTPGGVATAELTVVIGDVRSGRVGFRTVARGEGGDPWTALTKAMKNLTPGLP